MCRSPCVNKYCHYDGHLVLCNTSNTYIANVSVTLYISSCYIVGVFGCRGPSIGSKLRRMADTEPAPAASAGDTGTIVRGQQFLVAPRSLSSSLSLSLSALPSPSDCVYSPSFTVQIQQPPVHWRGRLRNGCLGL